MELRSCIHTATNMLASEKHDGDCSTKLLSIVYLSRYYYVVDMLHGLASLKMTLAITACSTELCIKIVDYECRSYITSRSIVSFMYK